MIQDFSLRKYLVNKKFQAFADKMKRLNYLLKFFFSEAQKDSELLVIVSGGASLPIELPTGEGKYWRGNKDIGKFTQYKKSALTSPIYVKGASAEKFCGYYEASDLIKKTY